MNYHPSVFSGTLGFLCVKGEKMNIDFSVITIYELIAIVLSVGTVIKKKGK